MEIKNLKNYNQNVIIKEALKDRHVPDDFYSTTNHQTFIFFNSKWIEVQHQRMDALIVVNDFGVFCTKLRDIKKGDKVVCTDRGVKIIEKQFEENEDTFSFMNNHVSSERRNDVIIRNLAKEIASYGKNLTIVAGPVVVHTGGDAYFSKLINEGYIASILSGNALAVHDIEKNLYGTSLGVCSKTGTVTKDGYKNHMRAINTITGYGSIEKTVEEGVLNSGIMYECVKNKVPFVLAGSLRDDGPLPETITDMIDAQKLYNEQLQDADIVVVMGSMLHGIATGNMLPARIKMICVDINASVVTKLSDRGSGQAEGIVTDVGLFLNLLYKEIKEIESSNHQEATS